MSEVIQADRDAAADLWSAVFPHRQGEADCMRRGFGDDGPVVAALAKHRLAHLTPNTDLSEQRAWQVLRETPHDDGCQSLDGGHCDCYKPVRAMHQYAAGLQGEVERLHSLAKVNKDLARMNRKQADEAMAEVRRLRETLEAAIDCEDARRNHPRP
jgi:hypothetical protein